VKSSGRHFGFYLHSKSDEKLTVRFSGFKIFELGKQEGRNYQEVMRNAKRLRFWEGSELFSFGAIASFFFVIRLYRGRKTKKVGLFGSYPGRRLLRSLALGGHISRLQSLRMEDRNVSYPARIELKTRRRDAGAPGI